MLTASRVKKACLVVLLLVFTFALLTAESHQDNEGSLNARAPTCLQSGDDLTIYPSEFPSFETNGETLYYATAHSSPHTSRLITPYHLYRAPPAT